MLDALLQKIPTKVLAYANFGFAIVTFVFEVTHARNSVNDLLEPLWNDHRLSWWSLKSTGKLSNSLRRAQVLEFGAALPSWWLA